MNLVKWFRKNNKKVMAVVVIVIMIGFIGGSALTTLLQRSNRMRDVIAHMRDRVKVRGDDISAAARELDILKMLGADALLRYQGMQNMHGLLLGELLFTERSASAEMINRIKTIIRQNQYNITDKQLSAIYERRALPAHYWYFLQYETQSAGIAIPNDEAQRILAQIIPQLTQGRSYSEVIGAIMNRTRLPEDRILAIFGKLMSVMQYAEIICSSQDITRRQLRHMTRNEQESLDVGYVGFEASAFTGNMDEPTKEEMTEQFDKYKHYFAGQLSDDNPYGLGYKQPARARLEYIVVKLGDVRTIIEPPTQDEMGVYYNRNKDEEFTEEVRTDPNDPNSVTTRVKSYAEVMDTIEKTLIKNRIMSKAETIILQAKTQTEQGLQDMNDMEIAALTAEKYGEKVGRYGTVAENLSEENEIKVYSGKTGMLSPLEFQQTDEQLRTLFIRGYGRNQVRLGRVVFAVKELGAIELSAFDAPAPRMYENTGPVRDYMSEYGDISETIMALVRVVEVRKASPPDSVDQTFRTHSFVFDPNEKQDEENIYLVKEQVAEDVKKLAAIDTAKTTADGFIAQAAEGDWQSALENVNKQHKQEYGKDANEPDPFAIQNRRGLRRISAATLNTLALHRQGDPAGQFSMYDVEREKRLADKLFSLVPRDKTTTDELPLVMEFKPEMSYYALKSISVNRLWKEQYEESKVSRLFDEEYIRSQSLAAVHFNPENILERLEIEWVRDDEEPADTNEPNESEAAS